MSRILIDPSMPTGKKFVGGPDLAVLLWFKAMCYSANNLSDGFVPERAMYDLVKARRRDVARALEHLCSVQPGCDNPSLYRRPGGWLLHDYDDPIYTNPLREGVQALQLQRQKSASAAGKVSAAVRRAKYGTAQPPRVQSSNDQPNDPSNDSFENRSSEEVAAVERPVPNDPERPSVAQPSANTVTSGVEKNVSTKHGDDAMHGANGTARPLLSTQAVRLCDWLLMNRGDHTYGTKVEQLREMATATQMLSLGLSFADVMSKLKEYREAMDPDAIASSLSYYYGRLQNEAHAETKAQRPHARTEELTRVAPVLPAQRAK